MNSQPAYDAAESIAREIAASDKSPEAILEAVHACGRAVWSLLDGPLLEFPMKTHTWRPHLLQLRDARYDDLYTSIDARADAPRSTT